METLTCSLCSLWQPYRLWRLAAPLTVRIFAGRIRSGSALQKTNVASEAEKRGITLKIADGQQKQENQIKAVRSFVC